MMCGPGPYYSAAIMDMMIKFGLLTWSIIFSLLVLLRLDKMIKLLEKK
jgi:hypothetical protein